MTRTRLMSASVVVALAGAMTVGAALLPQASGDPTPPAGVADSAIAIGTASSTDLEGQIDLVRQQVERQPQDARSWAALGLLLIEQGRVTADPTSYTEAAAAIASSFDHQSHGNDLASAARAALLSAEHRFSAALRVAHQALRLDPYSVPALGVRVDALTELGRLAQARSAAEQFDHRQPSLAATTRLAYQSELRGNENRARRYFADARSDATASTTRAFVDVHLGELARHSGDFTASAQYYRSALAALPDDPAATAGLARLLAVRGNLHRAITLLRALVARVPLPEHLVSLGELYLLTGDREAAREQFAVVRASADLARANGVRPDLELAWFEADHGNPEAALRLARAEWSKRQPPMVADALGWALHANGHDAAALHYAKLATAYGGDARSWHHRGAIEAALGRTAVARSHLRKALRMDAGYAPWQAEQVRRTRRELDSRR